MRWRDWPTTEAAAIGQVRRASYTDIRIYAGHEGRKATFPVRGQVQTGARLPAPSAGNDLPLMPYLKEVGADFKCLAGFAAASTGP